MLLLIPWCLDQVAALHTWLGICLPFNPKCCLLSSFTVSGQHKLADGRQCFESNSIGGSTCSVIDVVPAEALPSARELTLQSAGKLPRNCFIMMQIVGSWGFIVGSCMLERELFRAS